MKAKTILTNPNETELESAVQENLFALFRSMELIPGCVLIEDESLGLHYSPISNPMFRGAWKTRFAGEETESKIDEVLEWFNQRQASDFFWWTDPLTQPVDLVERLMRRGFDGNIEGESGMVAHLHEVTDAMQPPAGFTMVQATELQTLSDWSATLSEAFNMPPSAGQAWVDATPWFCPNRQVLSAYTSVHQKRWMPYGILLF